MAGNNMHVDKTINISHMLTTVAMVIGAFLAFFNMSERLAVLENHFEEINNRVVQLLQAQQRVDISQDSSLIQFRTEMREDSRQINAKLDRLIESLIIPK